jgi:hydroxymethylbilane synthase
MSFSIRIGTRASKLALWQAEATKKALLLLDPSLNIEIVKVRTDGDKDQTSALREMGGYGVFVKQLESELTSGNVDLAVHSAKDVPAKLSDGLEIVGSLPRAIVNDALISRDKKSFEDLPENAIVGTSSARRAAQLYLIRKDIQIKEIRGNVDTRIRKVEEGIYDATLLANAGLDRLGLGDRIDYRFPTDIMLPAPGQGIIALEIRESDSDLKHLIERISDRDSFICLKAERAFLATLNAGCHTAVAGLAQISGNKLKMSGRVLSLDGSQMIEAEFEIGDLSNPERVGRQVADKLLEQGAEQIIKDQK